MDYRRVLKIGVCVSVCVCVCVCVRVGCGKLLIYQTPPRSKGRRSRSQGHMKLCTKHQIYDVNVIGQWKYTRLIENRGRRSDWRVQIFDRKLLNSRFCAGAVKICLTVS